MNKLKLLMRTKFFYLLPYISLVLAYLAFGSAVLGDVWTSLLKCAPIVYLMLYIVLKTLKQKLLHKYSELILLGLVCSCLGDFMLSMDNFAKGMACFAMAQIFYIWAFGWRPLNMEIAIPLYIAGAAVVFCLVKELNAVLFYGVPIYTGLLLTMCWRSLARGAHTKHPRHIICAMGSILFVISDSLIGLEMYLITFPHSRLFIMLTYYAAQLAITLSIESEPHSTHLSTSSN